jgi:hypothetical protein
MNENVKMTPEQEAFMCFVASLGHEIDFRVNSSYCGYGNYDVTGTSFEIVWQ